MEKKLVLVHGYYKNNKDMFTLEKNLEILGYEATSVDLPLTFKDIEGAVSVFKEIMDNIIYDLKEDEKVSLIGHSTGGLIIRLFLSDLRHVDKIGRCVLIATPNKGSSLADIAAKVCPILPSIFKTLESLQCKNVERLQIKHRNNMELGAIAGNKSSLILGKLLKGENDGRVETNFAVFKGVKDSIILPYGHKEIHHKFETARLVDKFLREGRF